MARRLRTLGVALGILGLIFLIASGVAYARTQQGLSSLEQFSEAQNVTLNYNDEGQLVDRGTTEGADAIMTLLEEDWGYPVNMGHLDPADPVVNTPSEYMYQLATISYHVLHGTQTVVLDEAVEYNGEVFQPGTYEFEVDGRYWTDFDRQHPIEGPARSQAWSGTVHGLVGELGVGVAAYTSIQLGTALAGAFGALGLVSILVGLGLFWAAKGTEFPMLAETPAGAKKEPSPMV